MGLGIENSGEEIAVLLNIDGHLTEEESNSCNKCCFFCLFMERVDNLAAS